MHGGHQGDIVDGGGGGVRDKDEPVSHKDQEGRYELNGVAKQRQAFGFELDAGEERALDLVGEEDRVAGGG